MNILNKGKPKHKRMNPRRQWRKLLTALAVAISMAVAPAAMADMNGYDISNWQCGIDIAKRVFELVGGNFSMDIRIHDGEQVKKGDIIATMTGSTKTLLKGERTGAEHFAAHERHCHGDAPVRGAGCRNECADH